MNRYWTVEAYRGLQSVGPLAVEEYTDFEVAYQDAVDEAYYNGREVYVWDGDDVVEYFAPGLREVNRGLDKQQRLEMVFGAVREAQQALPI